MMVLLHDLFTNDNVQYTIAYQNMWRVQQGDTLRKLFGS